MPPVSSSFGVEKLPFSQYWPSGVIRIGLPVWKWIRRKISKQKGLNVHKIFRDNFVLPATSNSSFWPWQQCQNLTPKKWMALCKRDLSHSVTAATSEKRMRILLLVVFLAKSASACHSKRNIPITFGRCPDISPNLTLDRDRGSDWSLY